MPQHNAKPTKKKSDYLQFRPYHAFTAAQPEAETGRTRKLVWAVVSIVAVLGVLAAIALLAMQHSS